jgi:hypothetical protein
MTGEWQEAHSILKLLNFKFVFKGAESTLYPFIDLLIHSRNIYEFWSRGLVPCPHPLCHSCAYQEPMITNGSSHLPECFLWAWAGNATELMPSGAAFSQ